MSLIDGAILGEIILVHNVKGLQYTVHSILLRLLTPLNGSSSALHSAPFGPFSASRGSLAAPGGAALY